MASNYSLALSGGGIRGYAHLGAVMALTEMGVEFTAVSGGSSGAIIGALLCDGYSPGDIADIIIREEPAVGVNLRRFRQGMLSFAAIEQLLTKYLRSRNFEELRTPLYVAATNLLTGRQHIFSSGAIIPALAASSALPLLLPPLEIDGVPYADAGMSNNLPVEPLVGRPEGIIGIHVNPVQPYLRNAGLMNTIDRSMHIIVGNNIRPAISLCDIFIEPPALVNYHLLHRKKSKEIIQAGYDHVKATIRPSLLHS